MTAPRTFGSFKRLSMAVTIAALAAACGGGGGDGGSAPAPAPIPITDPLQPLLTGPGDPQNYVPTGGFDSWTYNSATSAMGTTQYELASVSIAGNKTVLGVSTTVFAERLFGDAPATPAYEMYYRKLPGGVAFYGNNDATDTLTAGVIPYVELLFPVAAGPVSSLTKTGLDFGMDLDGDGKNETVDATQTISITGFESVTVPAGTFLAAAKRLATIAANAKLTSNGQVIPVTTNETTWIAPGAGVIRRHTVGSSQGSTILTNTIEARGFHIGGVRKGLSNPEEVMGPTFGVLTQTNVGDPPDPVDTPAAASSGTTFLVLGKAYTVDALTNKWLLRRMGYLRLPDGPNASLPSIIDIGPPVLSNDTRETLSLAFGAGTYLAVLQSGRAEHLWHDAAVGRRPSHLGERRTDRRNTARTAAAGHRARSTGRDIAAPVRCLRRWCFPGDLLRWTGDFVVDLHRRTFRDTRRDAGHAVPHLAGLQLQRDRAERCLRRRELHRRLR